MAQKLATDLARAGLLEGPAPSAGGLRKAMRKPAVLAALGVDNSTLYEGIATGISPPPTKPDPDGRISVWWEHEIAEVQARAIARRDAEAARKAALAEKASA